MYSLWQAMCCSSVLWGFLAVWITMSSMYTDSHPSPTSIQKMVFIIIWNVARELVRPKDMTVGSNNPLWVRNAAFPSLPFLIQMLLYPQQMSTIVNLVHPLRQSMTWGIRGDTFLFFFVHLFIGWWSCTGHSFPFFSSQRRNWLHRVI